MATRATDIVNKDFSTERYKKWAKRIHISPTVHHAKFWEQMMIHEALEASGMLQEGRLGLGFGVGREQLVSVFAASGARVTATDQAPDDISLAWDNGQLADGKSSLFYPKIISADDFERNVDFRHHDMNTYEASFQNKFDFCWSNCVIGHLGSMEKSEDFLIRHAKYLKNGGISVLTTELNISSLTSTVSDNSGTIIWRLEDLLRVFNTMLDHDMVATRFKLRLAKDKSDSYIYYDIDFVDPQTIGKIDHRIYLTKIPFSNYAITPIQLIFRKKKLTDAQRRIHRVLYRRDFKTNTRKLQQYLDSSGDISDYSTTYPTTNLAIKPTKNILRLKVRPGATTTVTAKFKNNTGQPLFSYGLHTPLGVPPLVLATANPTNRLSDLYTPLWFSPNRPSVTFTPIYKKQDFQDRCHGYHRSLSGEFFEYTFELNAPKKRGVHTEDFCLVLETLGDIPLTHFKVELTVGH